MNNYDFFYSLIPDGDSPSYDPSGCGYLLYPDLSSGIHNPEQDISRCFPPDKSLLYSYPYRYLYCEDGDNDDDATARFRFHNDGYHHGFHHNDEQRELSVNDGSFCFRLGQRGENPKYKLVDAHPPYSTFLNVCSVSSQQVFTKQPVIFDISNVIYGSCGFVSNDSNICIWKSGYYLICISNELSSGFGMVKNGLLMNELTMGANMIVKITNDNLVQPVSLSTNGVGCNLQIVNITDATIFLPNVSFSLLLINDV